MPITLHVDLLETDLEDFDAHWQDALPRIPYLPDWPRGTLIAVSPIDRTLEGAEADELRRRHPLSRGAPTPFPWLRGDDYDEGRRPLGMQRPNVCGEYPPLGSVLCIRNAIPAYIQYDVVLMAELTPDGQITMFTPPTNYHSLYVARYGNKLELVVYESHGGGWAGQELLEWLRARWGGAVKVPDTAAAPPRGDARPMPLLPDRATEAQWLEWFDWYYAQSWGYVPDRFTHMESLCGKAVSTIQKAHANYAESRR